MSKKKATAISLPLSRTAKIMTSAVGVESVNQDIVALATKATEIFLMDFAQRAYDQSNGEEVKSNTLEYEDIHKLVHSDSRYEFLEDSIPKKIKFSEALKLAEEANRRRAQAEEEAKQRKLEEEQERLRELELEKELERQQQQQQNAIHETHDQKPQSNDGDEENQEVEDEEEEENREEHGE